MAGMVRRDTRLVILNNPNNPTGALLVPATLSQVVEIVARYGVPLLCDEVYRDLTQEGLDDCPSVVDLYAHGIATGSMSKTLALAGLRLGGVAARDEDLMRRILRLRDHTTSSGGVLDESLATIALEHRDR